MQTAIAIIVCLAGLLIIAVRTVMKLQDEYHHLGVLRGVAHQRAEDLEVVNRNLRFSVDNLRQVHTDHLRINFQHRMDWVNFNATRWTKSDIGADVYSTQIVINRDNPVLLALRANGKQTTCRMPRDMVFDTIYREFLEPAARILNAPAPMGLPYGHIIGGKYYECEGRS